jgi:hypothetical protein
MNGIKLQVFETLPEVTASDVGLRCLYKDEEWVVLANGEWWPSKGYKEYVAKLFQTSTNNPTQTIIKNTTGLAIAFIRDSVNAGFYSGNVSGGTINPATTIIHINNGAQFPGNAIGLIGYLQGITSTVIIFRFLNSTNSAPADLLTNQGGTTDGVHFEIKLYPPAP